MTGEGEAEGALVATIPPSLAACCLLSEPQPVARIARAAVSGVWFTAFDILFLPFHFAMTKGYRPLSVRTLMRL